MSNTKLYRIWDSMMRRCHTPTHKHFKNYGGRGITVCEQWHNFENFLADMGKRVDGMTLDRIDNSKGYSPDNCRWATMQTQQNNKRSNVNVSYNGKTQTIAAWARETGIPHYVISQRLKYGWSVQNALTLEPNRHRRVNHG